ncbi:acyl-CoA carboxylase subunit beta [Pyruvatibacter mobilis]|uniref:acyl-CoA carboxylase subunit beta n=1 Tax=Pyruvatibacter mobilis TaxID=1712261 RepID=UPI003BAADC08
MPVFQTKIDPSSEDFTRNRQDMLGLVEQLRSYEARAAMLSEKRKPRFQQRGQLTPRERLAQLLDPGMPFQAIYNMANFQVDDPNPETSVPGANVIVGIGFVGGVRCMVFVDDSGISAGAATGTTVDVMTGSMKIALRQKLPFIHLVESAGANLLEYTVELWAHGGGMFRNLALLSAAGIPTFVILHGPSTAGGAYQPGMSDYVIGIKKNGMAALAGAALVKAATGEVADPEQLGGSEMHASVTGLVEYLAEDDAHGISILRDIITRLDINSQISAQPDRVFEPPVHSPDELAGVVPVNYREPYDVREVVTRVVDGSDFAEFKPRFGPATICMQARIMGHAVGLIGNNGPIDPAGANKASHFFQLCDQAEMPIIFLNNTTGYMVGTEYEQAGMIKHGSKMIQAVSNVRVPKITLYIGASFGAGNYGMAGYAYEPDFLFAWPNATTGVMGGEQAAGTMIEVARAGAARRGQELDESALAEQHAAIVELFDRQSTSFYTSGRCLDHGIIDPRDTRKVLGFALQTIWEGRNKTLHPNAFGVARH